MYLRKQLMTTLALMAGALGMTTGARADAVYKGTFTLPQQAYWGSKLLPAGEYTVTVDSSSTRPAIIYVRGERIQSTLIPGTSHTGADSAKTNLKLEEVDGNYVVREFAAGAIGKSFEFAGPKGATALLTVPLSGSAGF